jgi:hypothetical protein
MSWLQISLWAGSVWLALLVGFGAGAAWYGMARRASLLDEQDRQAWARDQREEELDASGDVRRGRRP